jgi:hypothetical protein
LKYYARIPAENIRAALEEVEHQRAVLLVARPEVKYWGWNWIWRRAWLVSHVKSCFGKRPWRLERLLMPDVQPVWALRNCASWMTTSAHTGRGGIRDYQNLFSVPEMADR